MPRLRSFPVDAPAGTQVVWVDSEGVPNFSVTKGPAYRAYGHYDDPLLVDLDGAKGFRCRDVYLYDVGREKGAE